MPQDKMTWCAQIALSSLLTALTSLWPLKHTMYPIRLNQPQAYTKNGSAIALVVITIGTYKQVQSMMYSIQFTRQEILRTSSENVMQLIVNRCIEGAQEAINELIKAIEEN